MADVLAAVDAAGLAERRRQDMASAVRTVARLLGRKPEEIPANPRALALRLSGIAPLAAGLSAGRWNNVRSLFRAALDLVRPMLKGRTTTPLSPEWQALAALLPTRSDRVRLSRVMRWMTARGIAPAAVTAATLEEFRQELHGDSLLRNPANSWADLLWGWNRAVARVAGWPDVPIVKLSRRETYSLPWSAFPPTLKADVDAWLERLSGHDFSLDGPIRAVRPSTVAFRDRQLRAFASALVQRGRDPQSLTSLAKLVEPGAFTDGLKFYYERHGKTSSSRIVGLAGMLKGVARHWCQADAAVLTQMGTVIKRLAVPEQGMTAKNRDRLRAFDDPDQVVRLLGLPQHLREVVEHGKLPPGRAAVLASIAVAVELLILAPLRLKNLAAIDIERHLVRTGTKLHLVVPAAEVKNTADLEFELMPRTADLLAWYLQRWRPLLTTPGSTALFIGQRGGPKARHTLAGQVSKTVFEYSGLTVNPHLFRHIGAKIYLDAMPGGYEVMRRVLGHKKMDTTARFYTGMEGKAAAKHFDEVILQRLAASRAVAAKPVSKHGPRAAKAAPAANPVPNPESKTAVTQRRAGGQQ